MNERERLISILNQAHQEYYAHLDLSKTYTEALADALIANGVRVQRWIPVTERLPEENGIYLTINKWKQYEFHLLQTGKRMWQGIWEEDGVTHWMPLPPASKEEECES